MLLCQEHLRTRFAWFTLILQCFFFSSTSLKFSSVCPGFEQCSCRPNADKFDIFCYNLTSLNTVEDLLCSNFSDKNINVLSLRNCSLVILPNSVFDNFSIAIFNSECPFRNIENNSLTNVRDLKQVQLKNAKFSEIPYGLQVLSSMETLNIINGNVTQLTVELAECANLHFFTISRGQLEFLSKDAFVHTPLILSLDLSYNNLRVIHENTFDPLTLIENILLLGNMLLSLDGLFENLNPQIINVYDNNLTDMNGIFHQGMWKVISLNIGKNPIPFLNSSAFDSKLPYLKTLDVSASKYTNLDPELLKKFIRLQNVNLQRNRIVRIPNGFFNHMHSIQTISLAYNLLMTINGTFDDNTNLVELDLTHNIFPDIVNAFRNLPRLSKLILRHNHINGIYSGDLDGMPMLKILWLSRNKIAHLDRESFNKLKNLEVLELSINRLKHLNYSLKHLFSLKNFTARHGRLEYIAEDELGDLTKLANVDLFRNELKSINGALRGLSSLTSLNIAKNKLSTLSRDTFPESIPLKELRMGKGNKWECDCRLLWFLQWLNGTGRNVLKDEPHCHLPKRFWSVSLRNLTALDVVKWPDNCPENCDCECQPEERDFYILVNCSGKQLYTVPDVMPEFLGVLDLQNNFIQNVSFSNPQLIQNIHALNLADNNIDDLEEKFPSTLKVLKLAGNKLKRFPRIAVSNLPLEEITLSRNQWICDCETIYFRNWLIRMGITVIDVNETQCANTLQNGPLRNSVIRFLKDSDLCPTKISFYVNIGIGILVVLLVVTSIFLAYSHYHLHLKIWLYAHGLTWVKEDDLDIEKLFDAYVCHSPEEEDFVIYTFAPNLEITEPKFKLCIPSRDITCGGINHVTDSLEGITQSKRFIAILTKNFLRDQYCLEYLKRAFSMSLENKVHRVIVVRCEDISTGTEMNPDLKVVLEASRTLMWQEKMFWEKLRYELPKKHAENSKNKKHREGKTNVEAEDSADGPWADDGAGNQVFTDTQPLLY